VTALTLSIVAIPRHSVRQQVSSPPPSHLHTLWWMDLHSKSSLEDPRSESPYVSVAMPPLLCCHVPIFILLNSTSRVDFQSRGWPGQWSLFMSSRVLMEFLWDLMAFAWHIPSSTQFSFHSITFQQLSKISIIMEPNLINFARGGVPGRLIDGTP